MVLGGHGMLQAVRAELERLWASAQGRAEMPAVPERPRSERLKDAKAAQTQILLGFPVPAATDRRRFVMQLWEAVLGGQGGRLLRDLRDQHSLAYSVQAFYSTS